MRKSVGGRVPRLEGISVPDPRANEGVGGVEIEGVGWSQIKKILS